MYSITKNNVISMQRGDYLKFPITLITGAFPVQKRAVLENDDRVYFALMTPHQPFECAIVKKEFSKEDIDDHGNLQVVIQPEDTLDLEPGTYYYEVKMLYTQDDDSDIHIDTLIQKTRFIILD